MRSPAQVLTGLFALLLTGGVFWTVSFALSTHLGLTRDQPREEQSGDVPLPEELRALSDRIEREPENISLLLEFAAQNIEHAKRSGEVGHLMRAVQSYSKVLSREPRNPQALLGMASISFESGVLDRAKGYYEKYLEEEPQNLKARTDLALVHLQLGETDTALSQLEGLSGAHPEYFPARLSLALARKMTGNREGARESGIAALKLAPDEEGRTIVTKFLEGLDAPADPSPSTSPAIVIDQFFRNHPIVGTRLEQVRWSSPTTVEILLRDFPMEKMPSVAREKFLSNIREVLRSSPGTVLKLISAESGAVMEEVRG